MVVWPGGGGPVCHSSEVKRWKVISNGNIMMKEMCVIDTYLYYWVETLHLQNVNERHNLILSMAYCILELCEDFVNP